MIVVLPFMLWSRWSW